MPVQAGEPSGRGALQLQQGSLLVQTYKWLSRRCTASSTDYTQLQACPQGQARGCPA